jgi:hypothetical protein
MFRTLMIGAVSALTLSAAAFAQRRFGLIIAGAVLASIFAGLPISTVEAQSGIVGHGQKPGKRFPFKAQQELPQLTPEQKRLQEESSQRPVRQGPPLPDASAPQTPAAAPTANHTDIMEIGTTTFTTFLSTFLQPGVGHRVSRTAEPQAATNGSIVFYTANWLAAFSPDGGTTFTFVSPYTQFPHLDGGFCCDQTVIYEPTRDLMIWQIQYSYSPLTGKSSYRTAFANPASVESAGWCVYEWNPGDFGLGLGLSLDRPHVALSSNFVWYTANIYTEPDAKWQQTVMWRIRLDPAATCDTKSFDYFRDTQFSFTQVDGATDTMYWGSHTSNSSIRIYKWAEADSTPSSTNVTVSRWPRNVPYSCPGPDGLSWCARADGRILAGWLSSVGHPNGVIGFMWMASQGDGALGTFPFPYVHVARFDASTLALIDEPIIWNEGGAFMYPAVTVNDRGDIAGTLTFGGGVYFPLMTALILDDLSPAPPPWEVYGIVGSDEGADRWGDYYSSRRNASFPFTWVITGEALSQDRVDAWYVWMGRSRDAPPTAPAVMTSGMPPAGFAPSDFCRVDPINPCGTR